MEKQQPFNVLNLTPFDPKELMGNLDLQFFATAANEKIQFGLENVHYFVATDSGTSLSYGSGVPIRGAVNLNLSANGEIFEFHADNITYHSAEVNNGYDGDIEIAVIPESFATDVLGQETVDGVQYENADQKGKQFALTFEVATDVHKKRYVLYYCTATRPTIGASTKTNTQEVKTASLTFTARPHPYSKDIKANTTKNVAPEVFNAWNTTVHVRPTETELNED